MENGCGMAVMPVYDRGNDGFVLDDGICGGYGGAVGGVAAGGGVV